MATFRFIAEILGNLSGTKIINAPWTVATPIAHTVDSALASGDNTITWPTGASGVVIVPSTNETATLTLKGAGGDTGVEISSVNPIVLTKGSSATFIVNASAISQPMEFSYF